MSVTWEHAFGEGVPGTAEVLRAVSTLELRVVSSVGVGAAVGLTSDQTVAALDALAEGGWVRAVAGGEQLAVVERARTWLARNGRVEPVQADAIVRGFTEFHAAEVDRGRHDQAEVGAWLSRHRAEVLAAITACDRDGLRRLGVRLAAAVWPAAGLVPDPQWWQELAAAGEALAIADRVPAMLTELLHRSAATFAGQGDRLRAETQWVRALAILRRDPNDAGLGAVVLTGLGALYREWGRLSKALDADLALVDVHRSAGDLVGTAEALSQVAGTMRAAGRLGSAADYLAKADEAITGADGYEPAIHARILTGWGRALWDQGQHDAARRRWSRALAMLIDVDDHAADHVRALLATPAEAPLPSDYVSNTSSS